MVSLAETVRDLRRARGWTRRDLAARTGISERFLADIETSRANPSLLRLVELSTALGTSAAGLLAQAARPLHKQTPKHAIGLLGLRGAGKSAVGPKLAELLGVAFVELDAQVEQRAGLTLSELFQVHGEAQYRRYELEVLGELLEQPQPGVIATGGSLVTASTTFALLRQSAYTVWLRARPEDHWLRVVAQGDTRPMADDDRAFQSLCSILTERAALYGQADFTIDTSGRTVDELARELALHFRFLGKAGAAAS